MEQIINSYNYRSRRLFEISSLISVATTKENMWKAFIQKQNVIHFNPFVKSNNHEGITQVGHMDECEYYNGNILHREVVDYVILSKVKFKIYYKKNKNSNYIIFEVLDSDMSGFVNFKLTFHSDAYRNIPRPIWYLFARFIIAPPYKKYLNAVAKGISYYCTTGKKIQRNQFGHHNQFSKKY